MHSYDEKYFNAKANRRAGIMLKVKGALAHLEGTSEKMMEAIAETIRLIQVNIDKVSNVDRSVTDITHDATTLFANIKGKDVFIDVKDFDILNGKELEGCIIRSSNNDGEYIVGCRMPQDSEAIKEYVSKNYSE